MRQLCALLMIWLLAPSLNAQTIIVTGTAATSGKVTMTGATGSTCQITTTSLPNAIQFTPYGPQTLQSTGCTAPNWIVQGGNAALPTGLSMTSGGVISGTPTGIGSTTFNVEINNAANLPTQVLSITVTAAGADNIYCGAGDVPQFGGGGVDTVATLPTACTNTALANTPAAGPVKTVCSSGCDFSTISAAATAASCGWIIKVKSTSDGTPTGAQQSYAGFTITKTCPTSNWIWIESDQAVTPEGTRISPAYMGIPSLHLACTLPETSPEVNECGRPAYSQPASAGVYVPKIIGSSNKVITITAGSSSIRLIGLEVTSTAGSTLTGDMIQAIGTDHIIVDRVIGHGGNSPTWQNNVTVKTFLDVATSTHWALIDSYVGDFVVVAGPNSTVLNMGGCSTGEGPGKVVDDFLEAADTSSSAGGCGSGPSTIPVQDLEWRRNHHWKPMFWKTNDTTYFGTLFETKDLLDWKNVNRALIEGNILEHSWGAGANPPQTDQPGPVVELGPKSQSFKTAGTATITSIGGGFDLVTATSGVFPSNMTDPGCATPNQCKISLGSPPSSTLVVSQTSNTAVTISGGTPGTGITFSACGPGLNPVAQASNITFRYNIIRHASRGLEIFSAPSDCGDVAGANGHDSIHDNVMDDINGAWNQGSGACCAWGLPFYFSNSFPSPVNMDFFNIQHNTALARITNFASLGNGPSLGFGAQTSSTGSIGHLTIINNISAAGFGASAKGVCSANTPAKLLFDCWTPAAQLCMDHNGLVTTTATSGGIVTTANNPPYPDATDNLGCGFTPTGQLLQPSYDLIQFTNLAGANGGDYTLLPSSPYHNAGSDGFDLGANIALVNSNTNGVQ